MKHRLSSKIFAVAARWLCALLAALALPVSAPAQPKSPERWLFIFDLSPAMRYRLPATEAVLKDFFATAAEGRLQDGDNIGVWTYDQNTHGGQFPLVVWNPRQAAALTSNLMVYLRARSYTVNSRLAALQPALVGVITNSERLTIVIFSAGESDMTTTPYDRGINQSFLDGRAERKKNDQPFVVLIRTLSGKYIGCTVNFPPGVINIPLFLAPAPPTNKPPPVAAPVVIPAPRIAVPSLLIVGTNVGAAAKPAATPAAAGPTAVEAPKIIATQAAPPVPVPPPLRPATNPVAVPPPAKMATPPAGGLTNAAAVTGPDDPDRPARLLGFIGGGLLAAAIGVVVLVVLRPGRRPQSSLITSSMRDDPLRK